MLGSEIKNCFLFTSIKIITTETIKELGMSENMPTRNIGQQINFGKPKVLEVHTASVMSVFVTNNLIISGSQDRSIRIVPISLFPGEYRLFQSTMDYYYLASHLKREIMNYFRESK